MNQKVISIISFLLVFAGSYAFAAHPLISDDAGTLGKEIYQIEINGEYGDEDESGVNEDSFELAMSLIYGITDDSDLVIAIPYNIIRTKEAGSTTTEHGISDISVEFKWNFYNDESIGLALKPGITIPIGDEEKELGTGETTYSLFFIFTKETPLVASHINIGYIRNENNISEKIDIWHASFASELSITQGLKVVANLGIERNPDLSSSTAPVFLLGGLIYSVKDNIDLDFGVKGGLTRPETDSSVLLGLTATF
jgi:hypothetical protein